MAISKQKFREIVFQLLYSYDIGRTKDDAMIPFMMKELAVPKKVIIEALERVKAILAKQSGIDTMITDTTVSYDFNRIQSVERNVLRLGIYELFFDEKIPPKVAIAEAIRLSRKFSTRESAHFVNAVLDNLYKAHLGEKVDDSQVSQKFGDLLKSEKKAKDTFNTDLHGKNDL